MKKLYLKIFFILTIYSNVCSQQDEYWKNNPYSSWYSLFCRFIFEPSMEDIIPELVMQRDCIILENPTHLTDQPCDQGKILLCGSEYLIEQISCTIESGLTYQVFQKILETQPLLSTYPLQLCRSNCAMITNPLAVSSCIILNELYFQYPDATKLFILYHELQHHLYNDIANNHFEIIINNASTNPSLQTHLTGHRKAVHNHICRYVEYRADTKAMQSIECPYCLQEITKVYETMQGKQSTGTYDHRGYLHVWQFEPRINELLTEKKCCQHHYNTGKQINLTIIDESTLLNRLMIIQE